MIDEVSNVIYPRALAARYRERAAAARARSASVGKSTRMRLLRTAERYDVLAQSVEGLVGHSPRTPSRNPVS